MKFSMLFLSLSMTIMSFVALAAPGDDISLDACQRAALQQVQIKANQQFETVVVVSNLTSVPDVGDTTLVKYDIEVVYASNFEKDFTASYRVTLSRIESNRDACVPDKAKKISVKKK